jgi:hypothetical protein
VATAVLSLGTDVVMQRIGPEELSLPFADHATKTANGRKRFWISLVPSASSRLSTRVPPFGRPRRGKHVAQRMTNRLFAVGASGNRLM